MHHKLLSFSVSSSDLWANIMGHCDERSMLYIANEILLTLDMATASVAKSLLRSVHRPVVSRELLRKAMYWNEALSDSIVRKYNIKLRLGIYCCVISTGSYHQCPRWASGDAEQRAPAISLTVLNTLQKIFNQHEGNYAQGTAVRFRPALMSSTCIHRMACWRKFSP